jgi:hypothetical protein
MKEPPQPPQAGAVSQLLHYQIETTFLDLLILNTKPPLLTVVTPSGFRNIPLRFSAIYAQSDLLVLIIFDLICVLILMSVRLFVQCAGKPSLDNMIASATKVFILERRSSFAKESSNKVANGDVAADLPVPMHWADTSARKRAGFALSRCLTKKR